VNAWREVLDVNVLALSLCTKEAVSDMRKRGDNGYVIHISSMSAHRIPTGSGMYSASKFAVRSLTEGLRQELYDIRSGIRVSAISPGFVETEFAEVYSGSKEIAAQTYSRYRVLDAVDIAEQALFLLKSPLHVQIHDILVRPTEQPN
jgi:NADP-dependent 3-hydroxy acid dehydrogenase YdfG